MHQPLWDYMSNMIISSQMGGFLKTQIISLTAGLWHPLVGVPPAKSNADILMMQSTEDRPLLDTSDSVHRAQDRRVLRQRQVRSSSVVVIHVGQQQMPQVLLAEHHNMVETFPADRTDQALPSRRLDFQRQYDRKPARCQRITVSGRMMASASLVFGNKLVV